jgi:hypothetical protein
MNVAKELLKVAKELLAFQDYHVVIVTPAAILFEKVDFSFDTFKDKLTKLINKEGMILENRIRNGKWEIIIAFESKESAENFYRNKIGKWNEFMFIEKYGARVRMEG